jgi:hypothetical protein
VSVQCVRTNRSLQLIHIDTHPSIREDRWRCPNRCLGCLVYSGISFVTFTVWYSCDEKFISVEIHVVRDLLCFWGIQRYQSHHFWLQGIYTKSWVEFSLIQEHPPPSLDWSPRDRQECRVKSERSVLTSTYTDKIVLLTDYSIPETNDVFGSHNEVIDHTS